MIQIGDTLLFESSKRVERVSFGVVGIDENLAVFQGFEDKFPPEWFEEDELTLEEKIELADYMIDRWQKFKTL